MKKHTDNITAIVTVSDYGENFGKDNKELHYTQLEDIKEAISALANSEKSKMKEFLDYRFKNGTLKGAAFSDLYFYAMNDIYNSEAEAIKASNDIFKISGKVLPVTKDKMQICAELENGYLIEEKSKIAETVYDKLTKINRVYLKPSNLRALPEVIKAIEEADGIIIGPGSLYTNIIPNLLVNGVIKAIKESKAIKLYACSIMTEPGQTDNYSVADYINTIVSHCGEGVIDYCLYDTGEVVPEYIKKYNLDGAELVEQDLTGIKDKKIKFLKENMAIIKDGFIRHNSMLIADTMIELICDDLKFKDKQNDPEYIMMDSKLKADKAIKRQMKKNVKKKSEDVKNKKKNSKSKFSAKYSERIDSIKYADERAQRRKKAKMSKKKQETKKQEDFSKELELLLKYGNNNKNEEEIIRPSDYEKIRQERIRKFNKDKK